MTPQILTRLLREAGSLQKGEVATVAEVENDAFNSTVTHLHVTYTADASPLLPQFLLMKRNLKADWAIEDGRREALFYQLVARQRERFPMIVPCYAATFDAESGGSLLVLQDVSATHHEPVSRSQLLAGEGVPDDWTLEQVVTCLAECHAAWWESPFLGSDPLELHPNYRDAGHFTQYCSEREQELVAFLAAEDDWLPRDLCEYLSEVSRLLPNAWERYLASRMATRHNLTVTHGDAYISNFLAPRQGIDAPVYLIDWQSPHANIGAYDLAIMCTTFWTSAQRQEGDREWRVLQHYLATLQARGVMDYSWDELRQDYRLMILFFIHVAIWDQTNGSRQSYWWPKLQCLADAARDLKCLDLLREA